MSRLPSVSIAPATLNSLLNMLPLEELGRLLPHLVVVELAAKTVVIRPDQKSEYAYFIETGVISMVSTQEDGARVEVGLIGYDGMAGLHLVLGVESSAWEGLVQVQGHALRVSVAAFRRALNELPSLQPLLLRYVDSIQAQIVQSVVCNARHPIEQRLARWVLMTHDRAQGDSFIMTQEFISTMLGVRRPGVTLALGALQRSGLVEHRNGILRVNDRANLEAASCECYGVVRRRFAWLLDR